MPYIPEVDEVAASETEGIDVDKAEGSHFDEEQDAEDSKIGEVWGDRRLGQRGECGNRSD